MVKRGNFLPPLLGVDGVDDEAEEEEEDEAEGDLVALDEEEGVLGVEAEGARWKAITARMLQERSTSTSMLEVV